MSGLSHPTRSSSERYFLLRETGKLYIILQTLHTLHTLDYVRSVFALKSAHTTAVTMMIPTMPPLDLATKGGFRDINMVTVPSNTVCGKEVAHYPLSPSQIYREKDRFNYVCAVQELRQLSFDEAAHLTVERLVLSL